MKKFFYLIVILIGVLLLNLGSPRVHHSGIPSVLWLLGILIFLGVLFSPVIEATVHLIEENISAMGKSSESN